MYKCLQNVAGLSQSDIELLSNYPEKTVAYAVSVLKTKSGIQRPFAYLNGICKQTIAKSVDPTFQHQRMEHLRPTSTTQSHSSGYENKETHKRDEWQPMARDSEHFDSVVVFTKIGHKIQKMFLDEKKAFVRYYLGKAGVTDAETQRLLDTNLFEAIRQARCQAVEDGMENVEREEWK